MFCFYSIIRRKTRPAPFPPGHHVGVFEIGMHCVFVVVHVNGIADPHVAFLAVPLVCFLVHDF
jgi:hypothetical protein